MTLPIVNPGSSFGHRVVTHVATTALGIAVVRQIAPRIDPPLIRLTGGRLSSVTPFPALLLTQTGAKSGVIRTSTLVYFTDADRVIVIASNFGAPNRPAWYHNIKANPEVTLLGRNFGGRFCADDHADDGSEYTCAGRRLAPVISTLAVSRTGRRSPREMTPLRLGSPKYWLLLHLS
jgi:deazaflavin-dependent oxidoreductase (nitroreductase family)